MLTLNDFGSFLFLTGRPDVFFSISFFFVFNSLNASVEFEEKLNLFSR